MCNQTLWNQQSNDHFPFPIIINGPGKARTLCHVPTSVRREEEEEGDIHNFFVQADDLCHWVTRNMFKYFIFAWTSSYTYYCDVMTKKEKHLPYNQGPNHLSASLKIENCFLKYKNV